MRQQSGWIDIATIPVVRLELAVENEIADSIEKAAGLRMKADEKENGAVSYLEAELARELEKSRNKEKQGSFRVPVKFDQA